MLYYLQLTVLLGVLTSEVHSEKKNVLFIVIDDLRASLGCYGGPIISPNIDKLAAQSAVFTNAMVQQSVCAPSRTSFLTGRRPDTTRLYDFGSYWRTHAGNYTSLPQHFKDNGYITLSVGKIYHPGEPSGMTDDYPFSWTLPAYHSSTQRFEDAKVCPGEDGSLGNNVVCPVDVDKMPEKTLPDLQSLDTAENLIKILSPKPSSIKSSGAFPELREVLQRLNGRENRAPVVKLPFFLAVGFRKPHIPWKYPKEFKDLYPLDSIDIAPDPEIPQNLPSVAWEVFKQVRLRDDIKAMNLSFPYGTIPIEHHAVMRQSYYAAASYTDYLVGRLLKALEDGGYADNTIITLVGDHGYQLGDHAEWAKYSNFRIATRVPLMIYVPGVTDSRSSTGRKFPLVDPLSLSFQDHLPEQRTNAVDSGEGYAFDEKFLKLHNNNFEGSNFHDNSIDNIIDVNNDEKNVIIQTPLIDNQEIKMKRNSEIKKVRFNNAKSKNLFEIDEFVELVDMFPTLAELTGIPVPPVCPPNPLNVTLCSEGYSFAQLITDACKDGERGECGNVFQREIVRWKNATFSQYPRPSITPTKKTDLPDLDLITIMGYSMRTIQYHYTEWIGFDHTTFQGNWSDVKARELYLNDVDSDQDNNIADEESYIELIKKLSQQLQRGWRDSLPVFSST